MRKWRSLVEISCGNVKVKVRVWEAEKSVQWVEKGCNGRSLRVSGDSEGGEKERWGSTTVEEEEEESTDEVYRTRSREEEADAWGTAGMDKSQKILMSGANKNSLKNGGRSDVSADISTNNKENNKEKEGVEKEPAGGEAATKLGFSEEQSEAQYEVLDRNVEIDGGLIDLGSKDVGQQGTKEGIADLKAKTASGNSKVREIELAEEKMQNTESLRRKRVVRSIFEIQAK